MIITLKIKTMIYKIQRIFSDRKGGNKKGKTRGNFNNQKPPKPNNENFDNSQKSPKPNNQKSAKPSNEKKGHLRKEDSRVKQESPQTPLKITKENPIGKAENWVKKNKKGLKTAGYITLGTAAATGLGYAGYKAIQNKKIRESQEEAKNKILAPKNFSEKDEEDGDIGRKSIVPVTVASTVVGSKLRKNKKYAKNSIFNRLHKKAIEKDEKYNKKLTSSPENDSLNKKLKGKAKKLGINVEKSKENIPSSYYDPRKDSIILDKGLGGDAATLSHELGHAHYMKPGRSSNEIAKEAHKNYQRASIITDSINGITDRKINELEKTVKKTNDKKLKSAANMLKTGTSAAKIGFGVSAVKRGYDAQKLRKSGETEEEKKKNKKEAAKKNAKGLAISAALTAPVLISEAAASRKGIKLLKKSGASKEYIKNSKKELSGALGTYAVYNSKIPVFDATGQLVGTGLYKLDHKKKKREKDTSKKEK